MTVLHTLFLTIGIPLIIAGRCCGSSPVVAQSEDRFVGLVAAQPVEREIAGGDIHKYQITLQAGQFAHFVLAQRSIDATLILAAPGAKQAIEVNLTKAGEEEVVSLEAATEGLYQLTVRAEGTMSLPGSYRLEVSVRESASEPDRKRLTAEELMAEGNELRKQAAKTAPQLIERMERAQLLWRELDEPFWVAYSLSMTGSAYDDLKQFSKAIEFYEQGLQILRQANNRVSQARILNNLAIAYRSLGRYDKAIEYSEQTLAIRREFRDLIGEGASLNNLGNVYSNLGRYEKAIEYYVPALLIRRELKDRFGEAVTLTNLGSAYQSLSRFEKAIEYYEPALAIMREVKNRGAEGAVLNNLGNSYMDLSRYEKAIEYYEQALALSRESQERKIESLALGNLGNAYYRFNRYDRATAYYNQALAISRDTSDRNGEALSLNNLAATYRASGKYETAIEYYEKALTIRREIKDRNGEGITLNNLGAAYRSINNYQKGIEYSEQALLILREVKNRASEASALSNLAAAYRLVKSYDNAIVYSEQELAIRREVKDRFGEASALYSLALSERAKDNLVSAQRYIEQSVNLQETLRSNEINDPYNRASFLSEVQSSYELYTDLLMAQHKAEPGNGFDRKALEVSERHRARSLLDLLTEAGADIREGVDDALLERERVLRRQLNDKAQRLFRASKPELIAALKRDITQLETDLERAQADIRKASPHYAALTQPQPLKVKEIQQQLDAETLLLEYTLGEEHSYVWAISKDSLSSHELPNQEEIQRSALRLNELLTARTARDRTESPATRNRRIGQADAKLPGTAAALSQTLLGPVAAQLGNKRLVIVADGALQYIPFAMLPEPSLIRSQSSVARRQVPPLIVNHEVVSVPSASALAIQRAELAGRQLAPRLLAVIADPVFDRSDERFKSLRSAIGEKEQVQLTSRSDTRIIEHLAAKVDDTSSVALKKLIIPRLPFTRQEANQLLALQPRTPSLRAMDFQANRETVLSGALSQYRYVHFATHGWLDSERPGLSALVLSMVDQQGKSVDGFLRANDIYNLKLPAELVVLSACQTGLGKEIKGEGLVGLTRGLMYAGAARVIVSLWSVNDKATADLMTRFYEKMLKQQQRPAAALRAAQVEMWKQKQWHSPYFWSAFILQGDWR